jgi:hypothetical protein
MSIKSMAIILSLMFFLIATCTAQNTVEFQSVSGEFAKNWINSFKAQNPESIKKSDDNGTNLWSWGMAPKGSKIVDGKLITDPFYLRPLLNYSSDWMGNAYTDPSTGMPVETYLDPFTGKKTYVYLNPNNGNPLFTYSSYIDPKTGKLVYAYVDPLTGKTVYTGIQPIDIVNTLSGG